MAGQGPVEWPVPPGGTFIKIDRSTGQRLPDFATGANVVSEYIKDGQLVVVGGYGQTVDGGWRMGADVPLFEGVSQAAIERVQVARPAPGCCRRTPRWARCRAAGCIRCVTQCYRTRLVDFASEFRPLTFRRRGRLASGPDGWCSDQLQPNPQA